MKCIDQQSGSTSVQVQNEWEILTAVNNFRCNVCVFYNEMLWKTVLFSNIYFIWNEFEALGSEIKQKCTVWFSKIDRNQWSVSILEAINSTANRTIFQPGREREKYRQNGKENSKPRFDIGKTLNSRRSTFRMKVSKLYSAQSTSKYINHQEIFLKDRKLI